jgi:ABC-type xylose transport system permease subunit
MLKKYYPMVLYIQILLILLSILTYFAYLQALQLSPLLANVFIILGLASGIVAFALVFFAFDLSLHKETSVRNLG